MTSKPIMTFQRGDKVILAESAFTSDWAKSYEAVRGQVGTLKLPLVNDPHFDWRVSFPGSRSAHWNVRAQDIKHVGPSPEEIDDVIQSIADSAARRKARR